MIESDVHCLVLGFERCTWWLATRHGHGTWGEIDRIWLRVKVERFLPEIGLSFLFPSLWCLFHFRWFHHSIQWPRKESETKQQHQQKKKKKRKLGNMEASSDQRWRLSTCCQLSFTTGDLLSMVCHSWRPAISQNLLWQDQQRLHKDRHCWQRWSNLSELPDGTRQVGGEEEGGLEWVKLDPEIIHGSGSGENDPAAESTVRIPETKSNFEVCVLSDRHPWPSW